MSLNVHIYQTPFTHETRILKVIGTLERANVFDEYLVLARWKDGLAETERFSEKGEVVRFRNRVFPHSQSGIRKVLAYAEFMWHAYRHLRSTEIACVNAHSLQVLPVACLLKRKKGARLVYEPHELETETDGSGGIVQRAFRWLERRLIGRADAVICVNESIANWYSERYGVNATFVQNVPIREPAASFDTTRLKRELGISNDELLFVYQGALEPGRNVELLAEVFASVDPDKHILFLGFGSLTEKIRQLSAEHVNIHYMNAVKQDELLALTSGADVGIHVIENNCLNHYYCLPNKLWEFLAAGLPVVMSDLPELRRVVDRYDCGWVVEPEAAKVRALITGLGREEVKEARRRLMESPIDFGWHREEPKLLEVYRRWFDVAPAEEPLAIGAR